MRGRVAFLRVRGGEVDGHVDPPGLRYVSAQGLTNGRDRLNPVKIVRVPDRRNADRRISEYNVLGIELAELPVGSPAKRVHSPITLFDGIGTLEDRFYAALDRRAFQEGAQCILKRRLVRAIDVLA